ncbi:MAG: hypothetical protein V3S30_02685 [Thermoanaerobaculia bacterium]
MLPPGSVVVVHLQNPTEKVWGVLQDLDLTGVVLLGIHLSTFDDWVGQVAGSTSPSIGLSTSFVPMSRIERVFLDEQNGEVESYRQQFERRVGMPVETWMGLSDGGKLPS